MPSKLETSFTNKNVKKAEEMSERAGEYESEVTSKYFEDWDDLKIEGNPNLKETLRENIIKEEWEKEQVYKEAANDLGISVEILKRKLQESVENMIEPSEFFVATPTGVLLRIITKDGRWRNLSEVDYSNDMMRASLESKLFGISSKGINSGTMRYGYYSDEKNGIINKEGSIPPPTSVRCYGGVNVKLKKDKMLPKTTIAFQDTYGNIGRRFNPDKGDNSIPTPALKPHFTSFSWTSNYDIKKFLDGNAKSSMPEWTQCQYTEAQYHGGLSLDDVESIHISPHNGMDEEEIQEITAVIKEYNIQHPDAPIPLITY